MPVRYTSSSGGTCGAEAQRRVSTLVDLQQASVSQSFTMPTVQRVLDSATYLDQGAQLFETTSTDPVTAVVSSVPVQHEVYVDGDQRIEVSADFNIPYQTINDVTATLAANPLDAYLGSPFILRHETYSHDPITGNEVPIATTDELLLPNNFLNASAAGDYVAAAAGLFVASGTKNLTTQIATRRMHRFSLMWLTETGDWNNSATGGGWEVEPWDAGFIPFPTTNPAGPPYTIAVDNPQILTLNIRFFPYHESCDCAIPNSDPTPPWLSILSALDLPDDSVTPWYTL